jgi:hypothetical protein
VAWSARTSVPVVPLGLSPSTASAWGSAAPAVPLLPSCTRKLPRAGTVPARTPTPDTADDVAARYWSDQPARDTEASVGL